MCSRFRPVSDISLLVGQFGIGQLVNYEYNPNVAPTDIAPIIRASDGGGLRLDLMRFGLVPSWAKDTKIASSLINARSETIHEKQSFKKAYAVRRCVVPVQGFYEWKTEAGKKIPYMVHRMDNGIMSLAGIWEQAEIGGEKILSFSIMTGEPGQLTKELHDRCPIILDEPEGWIAEGGDKYFQRPSDNELQITRKNPAMNKPGMKDLAQIDLPEIESNLLF